MGTCEIGGDYHQFDFRESFERQFTRVPKRLSWNRHYLLGIERSSPPAVLSQEYRGDGRKYLILMRPSVIEHIHPPIATLRTFHYSCGFVSAVKRFALRNTNNYKNNLM